METLKIALIDFNKKIGGAQVALGNLGKALSEKGHEVHVILGRKEINGRLANICLPYCYLHFISGYNDLSDLPKLKGALRKSFSNLYDIHKFDVINVNGIDELFVPPELLNRLVVTLHANNFYRGMTLLRYLHTSSYMRRAYGYNSKGIIKTVCGSLTYSALEKKACGRAKRVVTLTQTEANLAKKYYNVPEEKISIVPNSILFPDDGEHLRELPIPENRKIIISTCSLSVIKGIPVLVKVVENILSENKDVMYISVGDGPLMPMVKTLASRFPRRVLILNHLSTGMMSVYARSKVFIHGSLYEAFCLSMAEAMLVGKPVVAFNMASIPEMVINNVTGYLVEPLDPKDLAEKAIDLLDNDEKARRMGSAAKKRIAELCNSKRIAYKMESVYKEAIVS